MTSEIVHPVPVDEVEGWVSALWTTLLQAPWEDDFQKAVTRWRDEWYPERSWGVRERDRWVATMATDARTITVPGTAGTTHLLAADALTAVTVAATHRRRGLLTRMITEALEAALERGDALGILIAAEWPIYGRYGYSCATRAANYTLYSKRAGATVDADPAGSVWQAEPAQVMSFAHDVFERSRARWVGQVGRPGGWWPRRLGQGGYEAYPSTKGTWIVHESADGIDGFLSWRVTRDFEIDGEHGAVKVMDFVAAGERAYRNLWAYLTGLDVIGEIEVHELALDEPVRWLLHDGRALKQTYTGDHTWLRLLDVAQALSARGYAGSDRIVLEVVDNDGAGYAAGRYLLDSDGGEASCTRTTESADLVVPQRILASAYLGDRSMRSMALRGGIDELTPGALARADTLFATPVRPWNATAF